MKIIKYSWFENAKRSRIKKECKRITKRLNELYKVAKTFREYGIVSDEFMEVYMITHINYQLLWTAEHRFYKGKDHKPFWTFSQYKKFVEREARYQSNYTYVFCGWKEQVRYNDTVLAINKAKAVIDNQLKEYERKYKEQMDRSS